MKLTPFIAAAILAFTVSPTRAVPLIPATLNQPDISVQNPDPIPSSFLPDGITGYVVANIAAATKATSSGIHSEDLPRATSTTANNRYRPRPTKRPLIAETMVDTYGSKRHKEKATATNNPHRHAKGLSVPYQSWGGYGPVVDNFRIVDHKLSPTQTAKRHQSKHGFARRPSGMGHGPVVHSGFKTIKIVLKPTITPSNLTGGPLKEPAIIPAPTHNEIEDGNHRRVTDPFHKITPGVHHVGPRNLDGTPTANQISSEEALGRYVTCMNEHVDFDKVLAHMRIVKEAISKHFMNYEDNHTPDNVTNVVVKGLRFKMHEDLGVKLLDLQEAHIVRQRLCKAKHEQENHNGAISRRDMSTANWNSVKREWTTIEAQAIRLASEISKMDPETIKTFDFQPFVIEVARKLKEEHNSTNGEMNDRIRHEGNIARRSIFTSQSETPANAMAPIAEEEDLPSECKRNFFAYMTRECKDYQKEARIHHEEVLKQALRHQQTVANELATKNED